MIVSFANVIIIPSVVTMDTLAMAFSINGTIRLIRCVFFFYLYFSQSNVVQKMQFDFCHYEPKMKTPFHPDITFLFLLTFAAVHYIFLLVILHIRPLQQGFQHA